jgi:hypothetical protein
MGNTSGNASLIEPTNLRSSTPANQTDRVKNRCVRPAWNMGEHELNGVADRWRLFQATS